MLSIKKMRFLAGKMIENRVSTIASYPIIAINLKNVCVKRPIVSFLYVTRNRKCQK